MGILSPTCSNIRLFPVFALALYTGATLDGKDSNRVTGRVHTHFRCGDIRGDAEVRNPKIFDLYIVQSFSDQLVECSP